MNYSRTLLLIVLTLSIQIAVGQDSTTIKHQLRIQDYVPEIFESQLRSIGLSSGANANLRNYDRQQEPEEVISIGRSSNSDFAGSFNYTTTKYYESPQQSREVYMKHEIGGYLRSQVGTSKFDPQPAFIPTDWTQESRRKSANYRLAYRQTSRYYSSDNKFITLMPVINSTVNLGSTINDNRHPRINSNPVHFPSDDEVDFTRSSVTDKTKRMTFRGGLRIGIGKGRIYDGTTTWQGILVLDQLGRQGYDISDEVFIGLTDLLYKVQKTLYPSRDQVRLAAYSQTEKILTYLEDSVDGTHIGPGMVAYIHDILRFTPPIRREFGRTLTFTIEPNIRYSWSISNLEQATDQWTYSATSIDTGDIYEREREQIAESRERVINAQIDWHDENALDDGWQISKHITFGAQYYENIARRTSEDVRYTDDEVYHSNIASEFTNIARMVWLTARIDVHRIINIRNYATLSVSGTMIPHVNDHEKRQSYSGPFNNPPRMNQLSFDLSWNYSLAWNTYLIITGASYLRFEDEDLNFTDYENYKSAQFDFSFSANITRYF